MTSSATTILLSPRDYDAVLFDLDGVVTKTAKVHAAAWKRLFDSFLRRREADKGEPFVPFDADSDYRLYVDGKPRNDGVTSFLAARGIELPHGSPTEAPSEDSIHALGKLKDRHFHEELQQRGVEVYDSTVRLIQALRAHRIKTAVVSSSRNCTAVLEAAGISTLFDTQVDGLDLEATAIRGKPAPDTFCWRPRVCMFPPRARWWSKTRSSVSPRDVQAGSGSSSVSTAPDKSTSCGRPGRTRS